MKKRIKIFVIVLVIVGLISLFVWYLSGLNFEVLNSKGPIALQERNLIYFALLLSLVIVIPVFSLTIFFAYKYRESNNNTTYRPDWDRSFVFESLWWIIPSILIGILAVVTWNSSYQLNPYKSLNSNVKPVVIQVVALDWRWLFIYPNSNIATVDYFKFPINTPVDFYITSAAPMNSFWIPQLGGQIYAMAGMSTELHLMASSYGNYRGLSANLSGVGFSGMTFSADAVSNAAFSNWLKYVRTSNNRLSLSNFNILAHPTISSKTINYYGVYPNLYVKIINNFMSSKSEIKHKIFTKNNINMVGM